jgi:hypothetical protein
MESDKVRKGVEKSACEHGRPRRDGGRSYLARRSGRLPSPGYSVRQFCFASVETGRSRLLSSPETLAFGFEAPLGLSSGSKTGSKRRGKDGGLFVRKWKEMPPNPLPEYQARE